MASVEDELRKEMTICEVYFLNAHYLLICLVMDDKGLVTLLNFGRTCVPSIMDKVQSEDFQNMLLLGYHMV